MTLTRTLVLGMSLATLACAPAASAPVPVDHFVNEDTYSQPRLSPDGKHIAVNVRLMRNGRMIPTMSVYRLPALELVSTIALSGYEIPLDFQWVSNTRLVVAKGLEVGRRVAPQATGELVAVDFDGGKPQYLYGYKAFKQSSRGDRYGDDYGFADVIYSPTPGDGKVLLGTYLWDSSRSMVYEVDTFSSARRMVANIPMKHLDFVVQNNGKPRYAAGSNDQNEVVLFRLDDASGEWRKVDNTALGARYRPFMFSQDDRSVYAMYSRSGGPDQIIKEDLATGKREVVAEDALASAGYLQLTAKPWVPFASRTGVGIPKARYLDESLPEARLHQTLSAAFSDAYVSFINFTDDGQRLLFSVRSDRDPGSYYLYDRKTAKAELLFTNMADIDPDRMAQRRPIEFKARDGLTLTGYLTMPANPGKAKLPMVLLPHGGPFDLADDWFFDTDAQFLASRGYAVLQVNFRGSGARGINFRKAGYREFGGKMLSDLADGVTWANALPEIDAGRVCVYGASFGGYAAMMLPVREPAMFKCAVGYAGLYDLAGIYGDEGTEGNAQSTNYFIERMGNDPAILAANSPTSLAGQIKLPVMLVHGGNDKRTRLKFAEKLRDELTRAGRPPEWMLEKDEGHGFYDAARRKAFFEKLEAFLDKHIGTAAAK